MYKYTISLNLLELLKKIHLEVSLLNSKKYSKVVLMEMENEANVQSAYSSTSIEGNPLPFTEVKKILKKSPLNIRRTEQEVLNYNEALLWLKQQLQSKNFEFNSSFILKTHQIVTQKILPRFQSGHFRKEPVFVNDPIKRKTIYWPPDHQDVPLLMKDLIQFVFENRGKLDPLILAGLFHKQFVIIHPFADGNGRTVRLMAKVILASLGLDTFYLFSFENYYNQNVSSYFKHVGVQGNYYDIHKKVDFTNWLEYFATGVLDELLRVHKVLEKNNTAKNPSEKISADQQKIIQFLKNNTHIQDKDYARLTKRAKATRALDFKKLIHLEIIEKKGKGPATYYILVNK